LGGFKDLSFDNPERQRTIKQIAGFQEKIFTKKALYILLLFRWGLDGGS
jgi:hypothetical protein